MSNNQNEIYEILAPFYDTFMKEVPYKDWVNFIEKIWKSHKLTPELVLDLACGTGSLSKILAKRGYDTIGIDSSSQMLMVAKEKDNKTMYLNQDMKSFELYGTVDAIVCLCDGMNYMLKEKHLMKVLKLCNNYLNPNGLLIFDMNTKNYFKNLEKQNFMHNEEDESYICETFFDKKTNINTYETTIFSKIQNSKYEEGSIFKRSLDYQEQRAYSKTKVIELIEKSGLKLEDIYSDGTFVKPNNKTNKIYYVCKKL